MSDSGIQINVSNESGVQTHTPQVTTVTAMDSVTQQSRQQTSQLCVGQQSTPMTTIDVSTTDPNQLSEQSVQSCSSANSAVNVSNVSMGATLLSSHHSEPQNVLSSGANISSVVSTSMPPAIASTAMSTQGSNQTQTSQSQQLIVSSSQPQMVSTPHSTHLNVTNAIMGTQSFSSLPTISSGASAQTVHIAQQPPQQTPILHTSVQPTQHSHMSVAMSQLPQVQVIQQPIGASAGTYQFQQVYPQQMLLPGNLTIQNMQFGTTNQGLSLQIPFTATNAVGSGSMPITSIAAKPPIMSKGVAISPLTQGIATSQHHMISSLKPNIGPGNAQQILKQVLPAQQFVPHSTNQTVVISQLLPHQSQHSMQQSILPATSNRIMDTPKGKPFGTGSVRSSFGNKMLTHSGTIQPKSPILPASSSMSSLSSSLIANSHFKNAFSANAGGTQLIATQTPSGLITNQPQILGSFQTIQPGLTWTTAPQSAHLVAQNGSPIFIRTPGQAGEHMYIQTSSPQIQSLMGTPINVHSSGTTMHVNAAQTQSSPLTATPIAASLQSISVAANVNTTTTTVANTSQPPAIAPAPIASIAAKPRPLRPASSVATQTATSAIAQKQHVESSTPTPPKPIAPAKPKINTQTVPTIGKSVNKEQNSTPTRVTSVAAATTQTVSQQTHQQSTKTDAANQTTKVSVGTETSKSYNQVSSSRNSITETNKYINTTAKSNSSTNTSTATEMSQMKANSVVEEAIVKPIIKRQVEKKDASTEQDSDLIANFFAQQQHNHQSIQNTAQITSNNGCQQNGQIAVLGDANRQDISKQPPQKAIVKPQILTHVIDGYIIQESPNPFPVNGLSCSTDQKSLNDEKNNSIISIESIKSKNKNENSLITSASSSSRNRSGSEPHAFINSGLKRSKSSKSKKSKRFSGTESQDFKLNSERTSASTRLTLYNSVTSHLENNDTLIQMRQESAVNEAEKSTHEERKRLKSMKKSHDISNDSGTAKNGDINVLNSNQRKATASNDAVVCRTTTPLVNSDSQSPRVVDEASSSSSVAGIFLPPGGKNPLNWSVQDVYEFVRNLDKCTEYADDFRSHEIDGQALLLLKEDHLMSTMNMKLGPALKICNKINALREDVQKQN